MNLPAHLESLAQETFRRISREHPQTSPPGVQVGVAVAGRPFMTCALGVFDTLTARALTPHSVFKCASVSKPICAGLAMKLVERGLIELDRPVLEVLPWRPSAAQSAGFDARAITPRMLLCHTAGWSVRGFPMIPVAEPAPAIIDILSGRFGPAFLPTLQFAPGTRVLYAGGNYAMLQGLIEHASGMPYAAALDQTLLRPAGLFDLWAGWRAGQESRTVRGHSDGLPLEHTYYPALGSSGLFATAIDLACIWSRIACVDPRGAMLSPRSVRDMTTVHGEHDGVAFGLGFVLASWDDLTICKHHGWCSGFFNITESVLELSAAVSVLSNGEGEPARQLTETMSSMIVGELIAHRGGLSG